VGAAARGTGGAGHDPLVIGIDIRRGGEFGVGTYIKNLVQGLARLKGEEQYVLVGRPGQFESLGSLPPNFRSELYPHAYNSRSSHLTYWMQLRRLGLDVFHMPHRWVPYVLPGIYVATLHDLNNILFPEEDSTPTSRRIRRHFLAHGLGRAAQVLTVSESTKRDAVNHLGLAPQKIEVVPDAVDQELAQPVTDEERDRTLARYQIHDPFVLYAGRIQIHKNVPRLIEAFGVVKAELENHPRYKNLRLIVIGDELSNFPEVRHAVMRTRIQHWVRFLGFVPIETLRVFYESAVAFLFPSLHEGFGLPPLEAMAQGTPVVTSSVSALPEAVGNAAVLVNPENVFDIARGLRQVLLDDEFREELRRRGYEQVKRFSWDRSAEKVLQVYRRVTSQQDHAS
jgi:glycosyltransferase involved in cell wall biosynthesis